MIAVMQEQELDDVMALWLMVNEQAHHFLPAGYWRSYYDEVRQLISQAEIYVWRQDGQICGFAGLQEQYLAGLFIHPDWQGQGIGSQLIKMLQQKKAGLTLHVFAENEGAVRFYLRHGFAIAARQEQEGHAEYEMTWQAGKNPEL